MSPPPALVGIRRWLAAAIDGVWSLRDAAGMSDEASVACPAVVREALRAYPSLEDAACTPLSGGLINQTYAVTAPAGKYVLQRLNAIFDPRIHHNIEAVTRRLASRGMLTPQLLRNSQGQLWSTTADGGVWRVMTRIAGVTLHTLDNPRQAHTVGRLVGTFHSALEGLEHTFVGIREGVHDTAAHLGRLRDGLKQYAAHPLYDALAPLAEDILRAAEQVGVLPEAPPCIGHGDLKISNLLFHDNELVDPYEASCLIDLDTLAPMPLAHELGDGWRSWCNRAEEDGEACFDMAFFAASLAGYRQGNAADWSPEQRRALLLGPELITVELAARFAADVLYEDYFGWDARRYARAGEHNLARAQGQYALHGATVKTRGEREGMLKG